MRAQDRQYFQSKSDDLYSLEPVIRALTDGVFKTLFFKLIADINGSATTIQDSVDALRSHAQNDTSDIAYDVLIALTKYSPRNEKEEGQAYYQDPILFTEIFEDDAFVLSTGHVYTSAGAKSLGNEDPFTNKPLHDRDKTALAVFKNTHLVVSSQSSTPPAPETMLAFSFENLGKLAKKLNDYYEDKRINHEVYKIRGSKWLYDKLTASYPNISVCIQELEQVLREKKNKETLFSVVPCAKSELEGYYIQVKTCLDCHVMEQARQARQLTAQTAFDATKIIALQKKLALYINQKIADGNQTKEIGAKTLQDKLSEIISIESLSACLGWLDEALKEQSNNKGIFSAAFFRKGGSELRRFYVEAYATLTEIGVSPAPLVLTTY